MSRQCLGIEFEIKTLGRLKYFLGIEMAHSKKESSYFNKSILLTCLMKHGRQSANQLVLLLIQT